MWVESKWSSSKAPWIYIYSAVITNYLWSVTVVFLPMSGPHSVDIGFFFVLLDWYQVLPPNGKANGPFEELNRSIPTATHHFSAPPDFSVMQYHRCSPFVYTITLEWADCRETISSSNHLLSWAWLRVETLSFPTWCSGDTQSCEPFGNGGIMHFQETSRQPGK